MTRAHERFLGARVLVTFGFAVIAQMLITLLIIRLGWLAIFVGFPLFFAYIFFFGSAFLVALRRLSLLRRKTLRFATPIFCTILLLFCSFSLGASIGTILNNTLFHIPVVDFDR